MRPLIGVLPAALLFAVPAVAAPLRVELRKVRPDETIVMILSDPAKSGQVSATYETWSADLGPAVVEQLRKYLESAGKPEQWKSDEQCMELTRWRLEQGNLKRQICSDRKVMKALDRFHRALKAVMRGHR